MAENSSHPQCGVVVDPNIYIFHMTALESDILKIYFISISYNLRPFFGLKGL
jgi:hypothetical protein